MWECRKSTYDRTTQTGHAHQRARIKAKFRRAFVLSLVIPHYVLRTPLHATSTKMFKRIEKRQRKKEKAEELGIDENLYDVQDSDSEDSHSDRSGSDDEDSASGSDVYSFSGIGDGIHSEDIMADDIGSDESGEEDQGSDAESDDSSDAPPMTIPEAVENPIYQPSLEKEDRWCIVCPGRIFKNEFMVGTHKDSKVRLVLPVSK